MSPSRRDFLGAAGAALAAIAARPAVAAASPLVHAPALVGLGQRADLVLRGGMVYDGTGGDGVRADLAISGGRVRAIGRNLAERGATEIDVRRMAVAPGFVDIHSHGDGGLRHDAALESVIRQGVTTIVVGQDGSSPGGDDEAAEGEGAGRIASFFRETERLGSAANVATMIGLGSVRRAVVGLDDRPATDDELARMVAMVEQALADGACGASSGLEYTPGAFASAEELGMLCRPLARRRLPYATHMRNEDDRLLDAIAEAIAVAERAGAPLQISHLKTQGPRNWGRLDDAFRLVEQAAARGMDVAFDRYPYVAYQTGLTNLFPVWSRDGGTAAFLARLADADTAPRIRAETLAKVELIGGWQNVQVTSVRHDGDRAAEGQRLDAWARGREEDPYEAAVGLLRRSEGSVGMVGFAMSEENLERILAHPRGMVCSDGGAVAIEGPARRGVPHPRSVGSFPRVLGRYVRERKALTLPQAIHKMSGFPAARLGLRERGRLAIGFPADVVVFDPETVSDRATFEDPYQYPVGIEVVVVNGGLALRQGERVDATDGKARNGRAVRA